MLPMGAETKQSDADRPMWVQGRCSPNRMRGCRDVSGRRDEYCEASLMDFFWHFCASTEKEAAFNNFKRSIQAENTRSHTKRSAAII